MCSHSTPTVRLESALKLVRESATNSAFNVSTAGGIENCTVATGSSNEGSSSETSMQSGGDNARPRKNTCKMTKLLCPFCPRNKANIANHIITCHSDKQEVKDLKSLPKKDKLNFLAKLHRSGMERSNKQTVKTGNKVMKRRKRRGKYQIRCSKCGEFLGRKLLFKHKKKCNRKNEGLPVAGLFKKGKHQDEGKRFDNILDKFPDDSIGRLCRDNEWIIEVGRHYFKTNKHAEGKLAAVKKATMQKMRTLGCIYAEFQAIKAACGLPEVDFETLFDSRNFFHLVEAMEKTMRDSKGNVTHENKLELVHLFKYAGKVIKDIYAAKHKDSKRQKINGFLELLSLYEDNDTKGYETIGKDRRKHIVRCPPRASRETDIQKLKRYILGRFSSVFGGSQLIWTPKLFVEIRNMAIARLGAFNLWIGIELSDFSIQDWEDAKKHEWIDKDLLNLLKDSEEHLLKQSKLMKFADKERSKRAVPLVVPYDTVVALDALADGEIRSSCGICESNDWLFPSTRGSRKNASSWSCVYQTIESAGVDSVLTATINCHKINKQVHQFASGEGEMLSLARQLFHIDRGNAATMPEIHEGISYFAKLFCFVWCCRKYNKYFSNIEHYGLIFRF